MIYAMEYRLTRRPGVQGVRGGRPPAGGLPGRPGGPRGLGRGVGPQPSFPSLPPGRRPGVR